MLSVLLVDDEPSIRLPVGDALKAAGHSVALATDGEEALARLEETRFDLVISDVRMPKLDGRQLLARIRASWPSTDVILFTAFGEVAEAVAALKEGALDYLTKPFQTDHLLHRVAAVEKERTLRRDLEAARAALAAERPEGLIVGQSPGMLRMLETVQAVAESDATVLITGESGTGKELVAKSLHAKSARRGKPFVAVNCAAFPESLIEAELFGHEKGAFTGAVRRREGRFKAASGGTLFLDEIAEIPLPAQAKLLRVVQEGVVEPLGTNQAVKVDVRLISATHRNLKERIGQGLFREDLFYRLRVMEIPIPPLRDRKGDLPLLVEHFLQRFSPKGTHPSLSARVWARLTSYPFPGNVRELEHAIQHACVLSRGADIDLQHLPADIAGRPGEEEGTKTGQSMRPLSDASREFEKEYLSRALEKTAGKKAEAAELLGISRKNLWEKLKAHGIGGEEE